MDKYNQKQEQYLIQFLFFFGNIDLRKERQKELKKKERRSYFNSNPTSTCTEFERIKILFTICYLCIRFKTQNEKVKREREKERIKENEYKIIQNKNTKRRKEESKDLCKL